MFDILTPDERTALFYKLSDWAHRLYEVGHTLARTALVDSDYSGVAWDRRQKYIDTRSEICDLIAELAV